MSAAEVSSRSSRWPAPFDTGRPARSPEPMQCTRNGSPGDIVSRRDLIVALAR